MTNEGSSTGSVLIAFALGAIAGAAIALLYAPAPGEETRRRLAEKAREGRERAGQMAREGREFVKRQRENLSTAVEEGREAFDRAR
jgi:gas vesicle protein